MHILIAAQDKLSAHLQLPQRPHLKESLQTSVAETQKNREKEDRSIPKQGYFHVHMKNTKQISHTSTFLVWDNPKCGT
jgi:hypothetical protein